MSKNTTIVALLSLFILMAITVYLIPTYPIVASIGFVCSYLGFMFLVFRGWA